MVKKTSRGKWIKLRVSAGEKTLIQERADAAGLKLSEYIRREAGIGHFGRAALRQGEHAPAAPAESPPVPELASRPEPEDDFEARVRAAAKTMPRRNAETGVRREEARERARAALAGSG